MASTRRASRLVPRPARRLYRSWHAERRTLRQGLVALTLSTVASFVAGLTLASITGTLASLPGLLVLIPARRLTASGLSSRAVGAYAVGLWILGMLMAIFVTHKAIWIAEPTDTAMAKSRLSLAATVTTVKYSDIFPTMGRMIKPMTDSERIRL